MPYTYFLRSEKDNNLYIGSTTDLSRRFKEHLNGYVHSTKNRRPLNLVGYRFFESIQEASIWEKKYKNSHGQRKRDMKNGKISVIKDWGAAQRALPGGPVVHR